MSNIKK